MVRSTYRRKHSLQYSKYSRESCIIFLMQPGQVVFKGKTTKGVLVTLRYPKADNLADLLDYINSLSKEKTFVSFQGEQQTPEDEKKYLDERLKRIGNAQTVQLLAFSDNKLIGIASIDLGERVSKHVGNFGISVAKDFRNLGVGSLLIENILKEAKRYLPNLKIITLSVFGNNPIALKMYQKFGFRQYGRLPKAIWHRGRLVDRIYMYCEV